MPICLAIIILALFIGWNSSAFFTLRNLQNLFMKAASAQIMAFGMTMLAIAGRLDLSGAAVMGLSLLLGLYGSSFFQLPAWLTILIILGLGALMGGLTGFFVAKIRMPSLLTTMAILQIFRGLFLRINEGTSYTEMGISFRWLGNGYIGGLVPVSFLLVLVLMVVFQFLLRKTVWGYHIRAIGEDDQVAKAAGIPVDRYVWKLFVYAGILYGLAAVVLAGRIGVVDSSLANGQEWTVLPGIVLGGCSLYGGKGSFLGSYLGILLLCMLDNGCNLMNVSSYWTQLIQGLIIFAAVFMDTLPKYWKERGAEE
ncbi:MAG: ABC transporter permease [Clostridiales bacterium]|nr:ABC transporter permease [Clostridiales bacterium]